MSIARNLKRIMDANAVSTASLAASTGIEKSFLTKYLAGKTIPAESVVERLADGLGVTAEEIVRSKSPHKQGKIRPEDAARRLNRSAQDIRMGLQSGVLPFGKAYKRGGGQNYTYEIDPAALEEYAAKLEEFWNHI